MGHDLEATRHTEAQYYRVSLDTIWVDFMTSGSEISQVNFFRNKMCQFLCILA